MKKYHNRIRSNRKELETLISEACDFLHTCQRENNRLETDEFYFRLVLDETLENARVHGNRMDCSKFIDLSMEEMSNHIRIIIRDEGAGFNPDVVEDPRVLQNRHKLHGRGLHIVKELAQVTWNPSGNEVLIEI